MKAIFEALPLDHKDFLNAVDTLLKDAAKSGKKGYEATTRGWDHKIVFDIIGPFTEGNDRKVVVGPKVGAPHSDIFEWVDLGTKPYDISSKGSWPMRWREPFVPKTSPGRLGSGPGLRTGPIWRRAHHVKHPGIEPRNFSYWIALALSTWFNKNVLRLNQKFGNIIQGSIKRI